VAKTKLLVLAGAGAAMDFGMPSSTCIHALFLSLAREKFPLNDSARVNLLHLRDDHNLIRSLYSHMYDKLVQYWMAEGVTDKPNFEDALHVITQLSALPPEYGGRKFTPALGAFVNVCTFPEVGFGLNGCAVDSATWRSLAQCLVYGLIGEFRRRCSCVESGSILILKSLFDVLASEFDVAVVTTNYDDLLHRAVPNLEMGFDNNDGGVFKEERILSRTAWPCLLHLHGSVHFDETPDVGGHVTRWVDDLSGNFYQQAGSRSTRYNNAGYASPASPIIVGYAKPEKIGELPYRTYYSELDRLISESQALLILGHSLGLGDTHLREAFTGYSDVRGRHVVVIDLASGGLDETFSVARAVRVFGAGSLSWLGSHSDGQRVEEFRRAKAFEVCNDQGRRLSIWYDGMREACDHADKIVAELKR